MDYAVANLESPFLASSIPPYKFAGDYVHFTDKDSTPYYLNKYNIKTISLANNHILDLGMEGMMVTRQILAENNISGFGAGLNEDTASLPLIIAGSNFKKVIFIFSGYWYRSRFDSVKHYYASGDKGGVNMLDSEKIAKQIKNIRQLYSDIFIIVYPHWGANYEPHNQFQTETAHKLINAGVDLIIGHGAHTVQEAECYKGRWIFYNIGNFIFNSPGRYYSTGAKPYGLMAELNIIDSGNTINLYPIFTNNKENGYQLRLLEEDEFDDCYEYVFKNCGNKVSKIGKEYYTIKLE
jgi:poly-gamma-glutamate capsule biosynthesis protein CapA/YwtB (metallophosphatase superfamily)